MHGTYPTSATLAKGAAFGSQGHSQTETSYRARSNIARHNDNRVRSEKRSGSGDEHDQRLRSFHLREEVRDVFVNAVLNPPAPNDAARRAAERYKKQMGL
jgi:hypothetical protein